MDKEKRPGQHHPHPDASKIPPEAGQTQPGLSKEPPQQPAALPEEALMTPFALDHLDPETQQFVRNPEAWIRKTHPDLSEEQLRERIDEAKEAVSLYLWVMAEKRQQQSREDGG